ncbi:energy-coupling factor ABC transporter ATP-binding protein [Sanguibacter inulinus]|uniref:ABC transporter ATP-binding protein n=1 Tax=Sanguibacter inulinus TaxID=60922 RepID=A0A853EVS4_9MICO|nr:ABC transporter ATP-binding protein [Sanguibacter inulinus]MBF0722288.1 ABC transporter ATP-binding protein [Sanguibacter inulinus]NYS93433.1 ABC transporter ATP-binding protein [Sanguibacter inulinus]
MIELDAVSVAVPASASTPAASPGAEPASARRRWGRADHGPPGEITILHPTTLSLTERSVAVIGANGSGKSTLARLLNGLVLPTRGYVRVHGLDTHDDGRAVRRMVGFVFSDAEAQLVMPTPREDVALSVRRTGVERSLRAERVEEVLGSVGLAHLADVSVHALSGGQKQLLALAGVLATEPRVLVCDEPTTLLDLRWRTHVTALLGRLEQQVVHVTHDLDAALLADRVLVVDHGRVVADGTPETSVAAYRDLMATRVGTTDEP